MFEGLFPVLPQTGFKTVLSTQGLSIRVAWNWPCILVKPQRMRYSETSLTYPCAAKLHAEAQIVPPTISPTFETGVGNPGPEFRVHAESMQGLRRSHQ